MTENDILPLASEFPPATREAWRKLAEGVLKGRPWDTLETRTADGIRVEPLYARAADAAPVVARAPGPWEITARIDLPDPAAANAEALHELEGGARGLELVLAGGVGDRGFALEPTAGAIAGALDGVFLDAGVAVAFDGGDASLAEGVAALLKRRGVAPETTEIRFGFDPLGVFAARGWMRHTPQDAVARLASRVRDLAAQGFRGPFAVADARPVHAAGGSEAQELAFALAVAIGYLRALEAAGIPLEDARRMIFFRLAADADQWLTAAKFRALRKLWARVEEACGLDGEPTFVSAETAWRMMTRRDPYVNMLRTTVATFAASLGGADAVTVLPFTAALGLPDRFARRMARNAQLILQEESRLAAVSDPGRGAGALEDLTAQLCDTAWALLRDVEVAGGAAAALERGVVQEQVAAVRRARVDAVARRKVVITGVSDFPNLAEAPVPVLPAAPREEARPPPGAAVQAAALRAMRLAAPFEALRDASDRMLLETGARPKVFLATLGAPADFSARAGFAKSFFEAGGIEAVARAPADDLAAGFRAAGAALACLCASDADYAAQAAEAARTMRAAGARHVLLAGRPGDNEAAWRGAGVDAFIYAGCDALAALEKAHDMLGTRRNAVPPEAAS